MFLLHFQPVVENLCVKLVFVIPERLLTHTEWRDMLQSSVYRAQLDGIIIDKVHCVKTW